jgi:hypothetical protein
MYINPREDFFKRHEDKLRWFTENKKLHRERARQSGMCSRCCVRRARPGKAYCQRCTDYAARYAKKRVYREAMAAAKSIVMGFDPFRDKITRISG